MNWGVRLSYRRYFVSRCSKYGSALSVNRCARERTNYVKLTLAECIKSFRTPTAIFIAQLCRLNIHLVWSYCH